MALRRVEQEALNLTEKERAVLAERLLSSLGGETAEFDEERWIEEAERRYRAYKAGKTTAKPADQAFKDARRRLE